ncbi:hypothetical protein FIBSPDRAFT_928647 [Athelia psychrophila]|uniref:Uncharacterized protein n=1 Tax=Athelia psychrophila TaxID=1759441 RepID=A0A166PVH4_9AGAM|nr:hypothetical protein FIBSPDRAFT_928647 [Fibularhizoctonia sp. CBS 109695]
MTISISKIIATLSRVAAAWQLPISIGCGMCGAPAATLSEAFDCEHSRWKASLSEDVQKDAEPSSLASFSGGPSAGGNGGSACPGGREVLGRPRTEVAPDRVVNRLGAMLQSLAKQLRRMDREGASEGGTVSQHRRSGSGVMAGSYYIADTAPSPAANDRNYSSLVALRVARRHPPSRRPTLLGSSIGKVYLAAATRAEEKNCRAVAVAPGPELMRTWSDDINPISARR